MPDTRCLFAIAVAFAVSPGVSQPQALEIREREGRDGRVTCCPRGSDAARLTVGLIEQQLLTIPGVRSIHDLHIRSSTSGVDAVSAHIVVMNMAEAAQIIGDARRVINSEFDTLDITIQVEEHSRCSEEDLRDI